MLSRTNGKNKSGFYHRDTETRSFSDIYLNYEKKLIFLSLRLCVSVV
jgi:hypothetical protein